MREHLLLDVYTSERVDSTERHDLRVRSGHTLQRLRGLHAIPVTGLRLFELERAQRGHRRYLALLLWHLEGCRIRKHGDICHAVIRRVTSYWLMIRVHNFVFYKYGISLMSLLLIKAIVAYSVLVSLLQIIADVGRNQLAARHVVINVRISRCNHLLFTHEARVVLLTRHLIALVMTLTYPILLALHLAVAYLVKRVISPHTAHALLVQLMSASHCIHAV